MPKYTVCVVTPLEIYIDVEAASEEDAIDKACETEEFQNIGGVCHQCVDRVGDIGEVQFLVIKE